jgi:hypothetical protein
MISEEALTTLKKNIEYTLVKKYRRGDSSLCISIFPRYPKLLYAKIQEYFNDVQVNVTLIDKKIMFSIPSIFDTCVLNLVRSVESCIFRGSMDMRVPVPIGKNSFVSLAYDIGRGVFDRASEIIKKYNVYVFKTDAVLINDKLVYYLMLFRLSMIESPCTLPVISSHTQKKHSIEKVHEDIPNTQRYHSTEKIHEDSTNIPLQKSKEGLPRIS